MAVELSNVSKNFGILENLLEDNYYFSITRIDGNNCTKENIKNIIDELDVEPQDVVFTFYGGHGSHAMNNEEDPWPQFCMNTSDERKWLPMALVDKWVSAKNPRLSIVMANCCNKEQNGVSVKPMWANDDRATKLDGLNAEAFVKLFNAKGRVMSTSSKLGQYSWCNPYGGLFTNQFWAAMQKLGEGKINPDWESLLNEASAELTIRTNDGTVKQNPYYKTYLNGKTTTKHIDKDKTNTLTAAISKLVDKSINQETRLAMIPDILNKHFKANSKVISVASDMTTNVDLEDAPDFLRRICLSPYIKGIAILNDNPLYLKVHELR